MNAYVLGAGASVGSGYPLASRLLTALAYWLEELNSTEPWVASSRNRIVQVRETFGSLDDFEAILGQLDAWGNKRVPSSGIVTYTQDVKDIFHDCAQQLCAESEVPTEHKVQGFYPQYLRSDLITALREYFFSIEAARHGNSVYDRFALKVAPDDLLVTFNYDVALERALAKAGKWNVSSGYGFTAFPNLPASPSVLYKLHGSVNWFQAPTQDGPPPLMFSRDLDLLGFGQLNDTRIPETGTAINNPGALILPDPQKRFIWERFWSPLWDAASKQFQSASRVFIHGYSLPPADQRARQLLFENVPKGAMVSVHCKRDSERIASEFQAHGFANVCFSNEWGFEEWVR